MAENIVVNGQQAYEEDYARAMSDPEFRALYEHEAQKKRTLVAASGGSYGKWVDAKRNGKTSERFTSASGAY